MAMETQIPTEVVVLARNAISPDELERWWTTPHPLLGGVSPKYLWEAGMKKTVLDFIESAKSGDMA